MSIRTSTLFLSLGLLACAGPPADADAEGGSALVQETSSDAAQDQVLDEFGPAPGLPEVAVRTWFDSYLRDPQRAEFELSEPEQGYYGTAEACRTGEGLRFAWLVTTQVSEADPDSGTTDVRTFHCWFRGDELLAVFEPARLNPEYGISASLREE